MKRIKLDPATGDAFLDDNGDVIFEDGEEPEKNGSPIFRNAAKIEGKGLGKSAGRIGLGVLDILNTPTAAAAKLRGQKMSDKDPYFFKSEVEKAKADTTGEGKSVDRNLKVMASAGFPAIPGGSLQTQPSAVNANVEAAGRLASDPMALISLLKPLLSGAGGKLKATGEKITEAAIKPDVYDQGKGFDVKKIFKQFPKPGKPGKTESLGGSMKQMDAKVKALRSEQGQNLKTALKTSGKDINAVKLWGEAVDSMEDQVKQGKLSGPAVKDISEKWRNEINAVADPQTGLVPAEVADNLKRRIYRDAEGLFKAQKLGTDMTGADKEVFAKELAGRFRGNLEKEIPGVVGPNRILSETRGLKKAVSDAVTRTSKNNPLSLTDMIVLSGGAGGVAGGQMAGPAGAAIGATLGALTKPALFAANRASKSPWVGNKLYQAGDLLQSEIIPPEVRNQLLLNAVQRALINPQVQD